MGGPGIECQWGRDFPSPSRPPLGPTNAPIQDQKGNNLERQKILSFIYPIYNHNWRNISAIYMY